MRAGVWFWVLSLALWVGPAAARGLPLEGDAVSLDYASVASLALQRNLALQTDRLDVQAAQARYEQAVARRLPTLTASLSHQTKGPYLVEALLPPMKFIKVARSKGFTSADDLYVSGQNAMLNRAVLYIPVYTGGLLESQMHEQAALVEVEKFGLVRAGQILACGAKLQYLNVLLAEDTIQVAAQVLAQAQETARYSRERLQAGVGNKFDVMLAEVAVENAQDGLIQSRSSLQKAQADLAVLLHLPTLTDFHLRDGLTSPRLLGWEDPGDLSPQRLAEVALLQRPELSQLQARVAALRERGHAAQAGLLPNLLVNFDYDVEGHPLNLRGGFSMITSLLIPIFDGGLANAQKEEVGYLKLQLETDQQALAEAIVAEVLKAALDVKEADDRLVAAASAEHQASEALRIASLRFQVGAGTSLELVTAQTVLANARFSLAQARHRLVEVRAALNLSLGKPVASL